jgi:molybdate transport system regulatory protein
MSYRRAWLLINALNQMFEEPVVTTAAGGAQGGGAALTPLGKGLVDAFRTLEEATFDEAIRVLGPFMARMVPTGPPAR